MRFIFPVLLLAASTLPAAAQLALPGATAPAPEGTVVAPTAAPKAKRVAPRLPPPPVIAEAALAGKTLYLDGTGSEVSFVPHDKTVDVSRLLLKGTKMSGSRDLCQIDVQGMPLGLTPLGKSGGVTRLSLPIPACPMSFDILDGAVLVSTDDAKCTFKEADCEVTPGGLWGPAPGEIGPAEVKTIERQRERAESDVRSAYKSLTALTKDRTLVKAIASEQAGFSSHREEVCRDYVGEARHGFCATRLTQARAATLEASAAVALAGTDKKRKR